MQSPTVVCSLCKREGHLKRDCPEDFKKIELDPLPELTPKFSVILDQVCVQCYRKFFSFEYCCVVKKELQKIMKYPQTDGVIKRTSLFATLYPALLDTNLRFARTLIGLLSSLYLEKYIMFRFLFYALAV